ncbi:hypothetical protein JAAARDRAFT_200577 [Jaapia argillacea MUCL 33604]|uniref:F-box domain-containing protein n=1 Tax=Jaapia argillacea MUCL 33604 TaxID=933084 RepID=A0A067P4N0_9AGAM|nr:hypothetical protein JAAARDRAFT_200577 [Jaapia argillacea MUCL 33604]
MHKAWNVLEIFEIIATFAGGGKLANVVSLALTCHDFTEPSLDIVWRILPDIVPLIKCMPPDLWETERVQVNLQDYTMITFRHSPMASDWERFEYYARRVKDLGDAPAAAGRHSAIHPPLRVVLHPNVYRSLALCRQPPHLLPELRGLLWKWPYQDFTLQEPNFCPPSEFITFAHLFINPHLTRLRVDNGYFDSLEVITPLASLMHELPITCPNLEHLHLLSLHPALKELSHPLSLSVMGLHSLRDLSVSTIPLSNETWLYLAGLPALEKLSLNLKYIEGALPHIPLHSTPFQALGQVQLVASLGASLPLLESLRESPIIHIHLTLITVPASHHICRFVDILHESERWRDTLSIIDISPFPVTEATVSMSNGEAQGVALSLQPLFVLRNMSNFDGTGPRFAH